MKNPARRLNAATKGGLIGMVAGKVKQRDEILIVGAAVVIGLRFFDDLWTSFGVACLVAVGGALFIRVTKAVRGVPRDSDSYR